MKIKAEVLNVLAVASVDQSAVILKGQLDRKLYVEVAKVLEACGAKWNRKLKRHVFDSPDGQETLDQAVTLGEVTTRKDTDFYETPEKVVALMLSLAGDVGPGAHVLEPSAGEGAIARHVQAHGVNAALYCVERDPKRVTVLRQALGLKPEIKNCDFLDLRPEDFVAVHNDGGFDFVLMNPPFSKRQDAKHILHAASFLHPKGRLVSVASAGIKYRADGASQLVRERATKIKLLAKKLGLLFLKRHAAEAAFRRLADAWTPGWFQASPKVRIYRFPRKGPP